jgi:hypothetical protein
MKVFFYLLIIYFISWTISFVIAGNYWEYYFIYFYSAITNNGFVRPTLTFLFSVVIFIVLSLIFFTVKNKLLTKN